MVTHPLADLLDDALQRGLVVPQLTRRMELGNHTKYVLETHVSALVRILTAWFPACLLISCCYC